MTGDFKLDIEDRDCGDHFKVVGLKILVNTNKGLSQCFAIYLAFARNVEP